MPWQNVFYTQTVGINPLHDRAGGWKPSHGDGVDLPFVHEKFGCKVDKISQVLFLVAWCNSNKVLGYFLCFQSGVWKMLVGSSTLILATFVYLIISDITLQGIGCFRRPRWFGGNESNKCKFTVSSKWLNMNYSKTDTIIQWDHDTMLSMCQWVCFTILIEMHRSFLPQVQTSGGLDVQRCSNFHSLR